MTSVPPSLVPYFTGEKKDDGSMQDSIIKINAIFLPLILLSTGLRFFVRFRMLRAGGLDDVFMILALLFAVLLSICGLIGEHFGLGKHLWNLSPDLADLPADIARVTKALYGSYLSYSSAITFTKFSIIATYLRIFPKNSRLRWIMYAVGAVVFCFWFTSIFAIIFTCVPVQAAWDYTIKDAKCFDIVTYFYVAAAFNIGTDLLLCLLPMPTFWALSMAKPQRIVLCLLFGIGIFACISSTLRTTQLRNLESVDVSYHAVGSYNWSVIEVGTALICASLSALRPLAARYFPLLFGQFSNPTGASRITKSLHGHPNFELVSTPGSIHVQKTFDVLEMQQPPHKQGKVRIRSGEIFTGRTVYEERSASDDDLVSKS
ncbi:hypothetical protein D0Z07_5782 [Hyphodiscus hymeniophilus]|uniref:Rhodopsin domain-containing protein n=1 Tax=Hyphodiscus hymeniophilus TaxID=353542 RepID=A0A9P6VHW0_9HELO|nr:hypothetical protein D0Z07_5782 [Hyphodiscus hymeniophilus]